MEQIKEPEVKVRKPMTREDFLKAANVKTKDLDAAGIGHITIKALTLKEREEIKSASTSHLGHVDDATLIAATVVKGLVEPKLTPQDIVALKENGSFGHLKDVNDAIWALTGVGAQAAVNEKNA